MTPYPADFNGDITRLETEVEVLRSKEDNLLAEVKLLRASIQHRLAHIARLNSLYSTIGVLPSELFVTIFNSGPSDAIEHRQYVKLISLVSRYWRNISLATPSLWSSVYISSLGGTRPNPLQNLEMLIERSCAHPLSITIYGEGLDTSSGAFLFDQINLIIPLVSRWRTLCIYGGYWEEIPDICGRLAELHAPLLESFEVIVDSGYDDDYYDDDDDNDLRVFTGGAPRLSYVRVEGISLMSCLPPLSSLVSLDLCYLPKPLTLAQWNTIRMSNQLQDLRIGGDVTYIPFPKTFPAADIPSLRSLTFSPGPSTKLFNQIVGIRCHALQHLTIEPPSMYDGLSEISAAVQVTDISSTSIYPSLQSLTLRRVKFTWVEAHWVIAKLPSITRIVIDSCTNPTVLLNYLLPMRRTDDSVDEIHPDYWPLLQTISLSGMESTVLEVLYKIVLYRKSRGTPLVCIQLRSMDIPADMLDWLRERLRVELS